MKYFRSFSIIVLLIASLLVVAKHTNAQVTADVTLCGSTGAFSKNIWGVDFPAFLDINPADAGNFYGNYIQQNSLVNLGAQMYRFPGGCAADSYDVMSGILNYQYNDVINGPTNVSRQFFTLGEATAIASSNLGGELLYQVNINGSDVPAAGQANICGETSQLTLTTQQLIDNLTAILSLYPGITYFELGNTQWSNWNPADYSTVALRFAQAMKAARTNIKIGIIGYPSLSVTSAQKTAWNLMISNLRNLSTCGTAGNLPCFDFVTDHQYPQAKPAFPPFFSGNAAYYPIANQDQIPQFMAAYTPKEYAITEWNLSCGYTTQFPSVVNTNTAEHGIFVFETLLQMAKNKVSVANYHDLSINPFVVGSPSTCGLFTDAATLSASGLAFALTSVAAGGEYYDVAYNFTSAAGTGLVNIPPSNCTDPDCLQTSGQFSILSTWGIKKGTDLYIFLANRSADSNAATIDATVRLPTWPGYTKDIFIDQLAAPTFQSNTFQPFADTRPGDTTGQFVATLRATSITRIRIADYFNGAPAPTPTLATLPTLNLTTIRKFINYKRTDNNVCTQDLVIYIVAVAVYIMMIHFAIAMKEDFKMNLHITCFVIGGVIGYYLCHLEIGFILGMILSLFLW
jgi:hypothetical protein